MARDETIYHFGDLSSDLANETRLELPEKIYRSRNSASFQPKFREASFEFMESFRALKKYIYRQEATIFSDKPHHGK